MKESLQQRVFEWVSTTAQSIGEWTAREVPLFITEYLTWKFWENMIGIGMYVLGAIIAITVLYQFKKRILGKFMEYSREEGCEPEVFFGWFAIVGVHILAITMLCVNFPIDNIFTCVKIKIAPKVYLIEEASKLIK